LFLGVIGLQAQLVTYTWTGQGMDNNWFNDANWNVTPAPDDVLTANVIFGDSPKNYVNLYNNSPFSPAINIHGLTIAGNTRPYYLDGDYDGYLTMTIGTGGITYSPAQPVRSVIAADFEFSGDQIWNISNGTLVLEGHIYDGNSDYTFTKTGAGTLAFGDYYNTFDAATIYLNNGRLALTSFSGYQPLGSADLIIGPATGGNNPIIVAQDDAYDSSVTLGNNITLNGALTTENKSELHLTGPVTLNTDTTIKSAGRWLIIDGAIADGPTASPAARKLTIDSSTAVILDGTNTYSGGTHVQNGVLVFASVGSLPADPTTNALTASATGYIGFGDDGTANAGASQTNPQGLFIDRFNKALTLGTIGFDTDPELAATNYTGAINLTGFATSARLGSATHAILSGTLTPQGTAYRFGGGGGLLQVGSTLTGARGLVLDSPAATPLTLRLTNPVNDYTGGTSVTNSALIFGTGLATGIPAGTRNVTINAGGYVGFEFVDDIGDATFVLNSLAKISTTSVGAVGYDNYSLITVPIDLSAFTNALYLATSTKGVEGPGLTLSGEITPAGGPTAPYRFAGYKGGALEVSSTLAGSRAVHIGDPASPATFGDYLSETYSKVALTGNNSTLTGPIMLYGGQLLVGQTNGTPGTDPTNALGSGTLEVTGMTLPPEWQRDGEGSPVPQLDTITKGLVIPNNVNLTADLNIAEFADFTLTGKISGAGELYLESGDYYTRTKLTLGNDTSDFTGGIYLSGYSRLDVGANHATGSGPLGFGYSSSAEVYFKTLAPVIGGLMSKENGDSATLYAEQTNTVLTINQNFDSKFSGYFRSTVAPPDDNFRIVKTGSGILHLDQGGLNFYHGTVENSLGPVEGPHPEVALQINQGTVVIGNNFNMGEISAATLWVHGGTLALAGSSDYYNPVYNPIVVDNGGRLAGNGAFASSVAIGTGAILSPGLADAGAIGMLAFDHLELNPGGVYEWQIQDANSSFGHDQIVISTPTTLVINATPANRFTLKVISLALNGTNGALTGFDPTQPYAWSIFSYDSLGGAFDPAAFTIDASLFANSLVGGPGGSGFFTLSDTGGQIMLNFTPVPEPSTYALLALGLGIIGLTAWRKRRAS
jgi:autotransporter-associated beta strand protein